MDIVQIEQVSKKFGQTQAVRDISLRVEAGEIFGLLGPNGAGKTTTIRMMLDILRPDSGHIAVFGGPMNESKKDRIGYLPEERGLYSDQKLLDVILYLASLKGMKRGEAKARAESYLKQLDLWEHRDKKLSMLSRGMHQKAQFIVTVLHDPDLLIVDEPFSGLDPVNTGLIRQMLLDFRAAGKAIIMSTHQMHQVEAMCDRMALVHQGAVVLKGSVLAVRRQFAGNTVLVSGHGPFEQIPLLADAQLTNSGWRLTLPDGVSPQMLLRQITAHGGLAVEHFSLVMPSLEEIFIKVVSDTPSLSTNGEGPDA
ncbi:MAG: ATP-binding cassette domain-containing protein [Chloroflexota bacterium]|jgi:ABC-2 type transport system ATP-binding protein